LLQIQFKPDLSFDDPNKSELAIESQPSYTAKSSKITNQPKTEKSQNEKSKYIDFFHEIEKVHRKHQTGRYSSLKYLAKMSDISNMLFYQRDRKLGSLKFIKIRSNRHTKVSFLRIVVTVNGSSASDQERAAKKVATIIDDKYPSYLDKYNAMSSKIMLTSYSRVEQEVELNNNCIKK